ncbi:Hypothetical protein I596_3411 [Dokdonella koreensis DS-123]|uniref:Uncharacterized protein n=1 Tax=Dokdonella koreensis DS-123 TaxID=1300342 RepID=A0A160DY92_9GAMM|nr:Hypothetical protein I596_3411 [Dokdonella koreensis DS-123]
MHAVHSRQLVPPRSSAAAGGGPPRRGPARYPRPATTA